MSTFKERLEAFIKPKGFTIEQVAKLAGVSSEQLGQVNPRFSATERSHLRKVLGIEFKDGPGPDNHCDLPEPGKGEWGNAPCNDYTVTRTLSLWEAIQPENWDKTILKVGNDSYMTMRELKEYVPGKFPQNLFSHLEHGGSLEIEESVFDQVEGWNVDLRKSALTLGDWELDREGRLSWKGSVVMIVPPNRVLRWTRLIKEAYDGEHSTKRAEVGGNRYPKELDDSFQRLFQPRLEEAVALTFGNHAQRLDRYLGVVVPGETLKPKYVDEQKIVHEVDAFRYMMGVDFAKERPTINLFTTPADHESFVEAWCKATNKANTPDWAEKLVKDGWFWDKIQCCQRTTKSGVTVLIAKATKGGFNVWIDSDEHDFTFVECIDLPEAKHVAGTFASNKLIGGWE